MTGQVHADYKAAGQFERSMVAVAQLVEPRIVIPVVEGSSPFSHPSLGPLAQLVEQETLNLLVQGSNP